MKRRITFVSLMAILIVTVILLVFKNLPKQRDVTEDFISSNFRVLALLRNNETQEVLTVATERANNCGMVGDVDTCHLDYLCGPEYDAPCYFFVEPAPVFGVDRTPQYLGMLETERGTFQPESLRFIDTDRAAFSMDFADAQYGERTTYELHLHTGKMQIISREEIQIPLW